MNNTLKMDSLKAQRLYLMSADNIESATSRRQLDRIEHGLARVYDAGFLTEKEYLLLDNKIVDKFISLDNARG